MRIRGIRRLGAVLLLASVSSGAANNPYTLQWAYSSAHLIVMGDVTGARPAGWFTWWEGLPIRCRATLQNAVALKGTLPPAGPLVVEFETNRACNEVSGPRPWRALWFLRESGGVLRGLYPRYRGFLPLLRPPSLEMARRASNGDGRTLLAAVLLEPGVAVETSDYLRSSLQKDVLELGGWTPYLSGMRHAYASNGAARPEVAIVLSRFAICVEEARRHLPSRHVSVTGPQYPYFDPARLAGFEAHALVYLLARTKKELRKNFGYADDAELRDHLVRYACATPAAVRRTARAALLEYFGAKDQDIPCPACS